MKIVKQTVLYKKMNKMNRYYFHCIKVVNFNTYTKTSLFFREKLAIYSHKVKFSHYNINIFLDYLQNSNF
ncbi:hypothetical protein HDF25_000881 [Pedobacter cryoconitis]|uniref:Uncharacterized protein n=1 Tax=Pedobacter cryoconitis TaxID=188932 RepID=A0A7X0J134_9SPHI|nr:hypothetical protein [Pedobacter cryoconitis]